MNMNENEKRERTTPPAQSATSPYTGEAREKIIHGLKCKTHQIVDDCYNCPYTEPDKKNRALVCGQRILLDALELLQALDVTPEELERLKKCRHDCKIDCLLEHYEKIKAERDALLEKRKARLMTASDFEDNPDVDADGFLPCWVECNEIEVKEAIRLGVIQEDETLDGWTEITKEDLLPTDPSYNPNVRYWTARPTDEQRDEAAWMT